MAVRTRAAAGVVKGFKSLDQLVPELVDFHGCECLGYGREQGIVGHGVVESRQGWMVQTCNQLWETG